MVIDEILSNHPYLKPDDIYVTADFAVDHLA